jgi:hypothetical protein
MATTPIVELLCTRACGTTRQATSLLHSAATPEGHGIEFDEDRRVIARTLVNVNWLLDRDGELRIIWPDGHVTHGTPPRVLAAAA